MEDAGNEGIRAKKVDHAAESLEEQIQKISSDKERFLRLADCYAVQGKLDQALEAYYNALKYISIQPNQLCHLVTALVDQVKDGLHIEKQALSENDSRQLFSCNICNSLWIDPVTIPCGHSFCRRCIEKQHPRNCKQCGFALKASTELRTDVLLSLCVEKVYPDALKALQLRDEGNQLFEKNNFQDAVQFYTEALKHVPDDYKLIGNRSYAYASMNLFPEALCDAELAIKICPSWYKGYYRKGQALDGLYRHKEAVLSYLQCLAIDSSLTSAKVALAKSLHKVMSLEPQDIANQTDLHMMSKVSSWQHISIASLPIGTLLSMDTLNQLQSSLQQSMKDARNMKIQQELTTDVISSVSHDLSKQPRDEIRETGLNSYQSSCLEKLSRDDFECSLCYRMLYQPVTTPCGHVYCRQCLYRCLDHKATCPLCKGSLTEYLAERRQAVTEAVERIQSSFFPDDFLEIKNVHEQEQTELANMGLESDDEIPIFVCTLAYPNVPCPLHIFEPKYRLMIRRCEESRSRQFGMCICFEENESNFAETGCMLEIRDVQYLPDGRSLVDTIGVRRFKVISRGSRDGYNSAKVEFLKDIMQDEDDSHDLLDLHQSVHREAHEWFDSIGLIPRTRIAHHFGAFPDLQPDTISQPDGPPWIWWILAVLPLDAQRKHDILGMTSLRARLIAIRDVLISLRQRRSR